jgi:hypothetical protein
MIKAYSPYAYEMVMVNDTAWTRRKMRSTLTKIYNKKGGKSGNRKIERTNNPPKNSGEVKKKWRRRQRKEKTRRGGGAEHRRKMSIKQLQRFQRFSNSRLSSESGCCILTDALL